MFKRILVPVDFSPFSEHALREALELAERTGAAVGVLHVWEPSPYVTPTSLIYMNGAQRSFWDHMKSELETRLAETIERCRDERPIDVEAMVEAGYASDNILDKLKSGAFDLVVMGTHGRGWLSSVLLGSVTAKVVRHAPCPVLSIRAPEPEEKETSRAGGAGGVGLSTPTHV